MICNSTSAISGALRPGRRCRLAVWDALYVKLKQHLNSFRAWVSIGTVAVLLVGIGLIVAAYSGWDVGTGDHDKGITVTVAVTIAAAVLGAVAAVLALAAYLSASGTPDLWVKITFSFCEPNEAVFQVGPPRQQDGWIPLIEPMKQGLAQVELYNRSIYSAHNPGIRIQLIGISVANRYKPNGAKGMKPWEDIAIKGWSAFKPINMIGPTIYQWDGGADQIIHSKWSRSLPPFDLRGAHIISGASVVMLRVTIVADGVSPIHQEIAVKPLDANQWSEWVSHRSISAESGAIVLCKPAAGDTKTRQPAPESLGNGAAAQPRGEGSSPGQK